MTESLIQKNSCGVCRACCVYLHIPKTEDEEENRKQRTWLISGENEKPAGVPCPQLNPNKMRFGCSIHNNPDKPSVCSSYLCGYALGVISGDLKNRPDNLGVILDTYEGRIRITEVEKKALERDRVKRMMWAFMEAAKQDTEKEWVLEIIPLELMGQKLGTQIPIVPANKLSIGKKDDNSAG